MPTQHSRKLLLNYSGMSRLGSITEGPQPQPTTQPGSQAPHPTVSRGTHQGAPGHSRTPPLARTLINSFMRHKVNPMETCQLSFLLGQAPLLAGTLTTLVKLFLRELGASDLGVRLICGSLGCLILRWSLTWGSLGCVILMGSDLLLRLHFCTSVDVWLPFFRLPFAPTRLPLVSTKPGLTWWIGLAAFLTLDPEMRPLGTASRGCTHLGFQSLVPL